MRLFKQLLVLLILFHLLSLCLYFKRSQGRSKNYNRTYYQLENSSYSSQESALSKEKQILSRPIPPLTPSQKEQWEQALKELGHDEYRVRQAAYEHILQLGRGVLPYLEKQENHPDLQVQETLKELKAKLNGE